MNQESPQQARFREMYAGQPPWDVGHAQQAFVDIADRISGSILDVGCGTGDNALFFAERGYTVCGIDFLDDAIAAASSKTSARELDARFLVIDALTMDGLEQSFDNVIDCGLFHVLDDEERLRYVVSLHNVIKQGGCLWLMCFSDKEPPGNGPRRISQRDIRTAFVDGWEVVSIDDVRFETADGVRAGSFSDGGPRAYMALVRRSP